jgi:NAD(P)-dependent dehydrogenase (short-subunit alcohol dehydrogenase family)
MAQEGARVVVADIRDGELAETTQRIKAAGGEAYSIRCDIGSEQQVVDMVAEAQDRLGGLDSLTTSAGVFTRGSVQDLTLHDWEMVLRVNLTGTFLCIREAIPPMLEAGGGSIVTIGSISSVVVGVGDTSACYKVSKAAVLQLTRTTAVEYAREGIRANCVCPGGVETPFSAHGEQLASMTTTIPTRDYPKLPGITPMGRQAKPEEIAAVVAFLVSDDASFITGSAILADGGYTSI